VVKINDRLAVVLRSNAAILIMDKMGTPGEGTRPIVFGKGDAV
jgi:hypothetical protein